MEDNGEENSKIVQQTKLKKQLLEKAKLKAARKWKKKQAKKNIDKLKSDLASKTTEILTMREKGASMKLNWLERKI
jgi:hypothetical protein